MRMKEYSVSLLNRSVYLVCFKNAVMMVSDMSVHKNVCVVHTESKMLCLYVSTSSMLVYCASTRNTVVLGG